MSHYKPYPAYKDSGVEWLGQVPEHWATPALKFLVSIPITDGPHETPNPDDSGDGIPFISAEAVSSGVIDFGKAWGFISRTDHERYAKKYKPAINDIYMVKSGATTGITAIVEDGREFNIWSPLAAIRAGDMVSPRFLLNALRSTSFQDGVVLNWSYGTQQNIGMKVLGTLQVPLPHPNEQKKIIKVLDRESARIDALIAKKTRFIELLKEKRQALITHAVTKGISPDVKMRDSGVEWIGEVPEHWDVAPFKRWFSTVSGGTPDTSKQDLYYAKTGGIPWIRTTDLTNGPVVSHEISITERALQETACRLVPSDSVLVAMYGGEGTIGKNGLLKFPCSINQAVCALLPSHSFDPEFTFYYITFYRPHWMVDAASTRKDPNISQDLIRSASIVHPPIEEQRRIVRYIKKSGGRIDLLTEKTQRSIDLLKERRSAFITAAVTGQIDLREAA